MGFLKSGRPTDDYTESLEKEVGVVKASEEWRREYMTLLMRDKEKYSLWRSGKRCMSGEEKQNPIYC